MRRLQFLIGLTLLATMAMTCLGLDLLSRSPRFTQFTEGGELDRFKGGGGVFMNRGWFVDFEDRMLLDEIPNADLSSGGVFFFGTSAMKWGLTTWELNPVDRALVHNFGIGATNHRYVSQFIRHLVEHEGLLQAGGGKVQIVLSCFWSMGKDWGEGFFTKLWSRYQLFEYDKGHGIRPVETSTLQRAWKVEQARLAGFVSQNARRVARYVASAAGVRLSADRGNQMGKGDIRKRALETADVPNWKAELDEQMAELDALIRYLRERGVTVTVVLLPTRTEYDGLPLPESYKVRVKTAAAENLVQFVDLSRLLGDDEFVDVNHANYQGLQKLDRALMGLVRPHLDRLHGATH